MNTKVEEPVIEPVVDTPPTTDPPVEEPIEDVVEEPVVDTPPTSEEPVVEEQSVTEPPTTEQSEPVVEEQSVTEPIVEQSRELDSVTEEVDSDSDSDSEDSVRGPVKSRRKGRSKQPTTRKKGSKGASLPDINLPTKQIEQGADAVADEMRREFRITEKARKKAEKDPNRRTSGIKIALWLLFGYTMYRMYIRTPFKEKFNEILEDDLFN
jgi:hypothetical protein